MAVFASRQIVVPSTGKQLGDYTVGESVFLNVNGAAREFLVVNQGVPSASSLYDSSCDGTWLLMKDLYESRQWHGSNSNSYKDSTIHSYLNSTFLGLLDSDIQAAIKEVKIPYVNGANSDGSVSSGANGLSAKIFLLSGYEVGFTTSVSSYFPVDGSKLDYFESGDTADGTNRARRIAYLNGMAAYWWLRSPYTDLPHLKIGAWCVLNIGNCGGIDCTNSYGIRPALVLPYNTKFDPDTNQFKGVS